MRSGIHSRENGLYLSADVPANAEERLAEVMEFRVEGGPTEANGRRERCYSKRAFT